MSRYLGSAVFVLGLALTFSLLGRDALPKVDENPQAYGLRLLNLGATAAENLYIKALLLTPGAASATVKSTLDAGAPLPTSSPAKQDVLVQKVAKSEDEISAQQDVSAKRYAESRKDAPSRDDVVVLPEQPDDVRQRMPTVDPQGPEMRCGKAIPPKSSVTTRGVEITAKSDFQGSRGRQHAWKYTIRFTNHGKETVQMLTRHWLFVDSTGRLANEVKGPGARGVTPVLPPGGEWSYESGTSLETSYGSMYGSFQFEVLKGDTAPGRGSFSARVGRLLLSKDSQPRDVPCVDVKDSELLPGTGVLVTERVIVGAQGDFTRRKNKKHHFSFDVQINNAREAAVDVVGHKWELVDEAGKWHIIADGEGVGGIYRHRSRQLAAGDAFRTQGELVSPTPYANAKGTYKVIIKGDNGLPVEIEASTDWIGLAAEQGESRVQNFVVDKRLR
mmetsp:Transcript_8744/g.16579  ORF Transcript_8744/g.16579 Transcript_8744/m.16579 type:complete len:445 (+) Transcript_8744:34-1368(+)